MSRLALPLALLLLLAQPASADDARPPQPQPRGYVGVSLGIFVFAGELSVDGGFRPLRKVDYLWIHAKALSGDDSSGDFLRYKYRAGLAGVEVRSSGRRLRGVFGFDVGLARVQQYNEGDPDGKTTQRVGSWHGGGELVIHPAVIRFGLTGAARQPIMPLLTLGVGVQF